MNKLRLYLVLMAMLLPLAGWCAVGDEFQSDVSNVPVWFTVTGDNTVKVGRLDGSKDNRAIDANTAGAIDLPETVNYNGTVYNVTEIGDFSFYGCQYLTSVTIPKSVTSIGEQAFPLCIGLTSLTIPNNVTSIGNYAFIACNGLTSVTIPEGTTSIGDYAFSSCSGLTSVTIPNSATSMGTGVFLACSVLKDVYSKIKSPFAVDATFFSQISSSAFLHVPSGCKSKYAATDGWKDYFLQIVEEGKEDEIETVEFQSVVSNILVWFTITGENTVKVGRKIGRGDNPAIDASSVGVIDLPETVEHEGTVYNVTEIGAFAFYNCSALTFVSIPNSITSIGNNAFGSCKSLTSVTIPKSVTSIGDYAFFNCQGLSSVTIADGVTSIGEKAFAMCSGLTSVTIPNSVISFGNGVFYYCTGLKDVYSEIKSPFAVDATFFSNIGYNTSSILHVATGCKSLYETTDGWNSSFRRIDEGGKETLEFQTFISNVLVWFTTSGENTVKVGRKVGNWDNVAIDASSGREINLPETIEYNGAVYSVTEIGDYAFSKCSGLDSVTIPNSVTSIGIHAFYNCLFNSVTIPSSVVAIGRAFGECYFLKYVRSEIKNPFAIDANVFYRISSDAVLSVPIGCKALYEAAGGWSSSFSQIVEEEKEEEVKPVEFQAVVSNVHVWFTVTGENTVKVGRSSGSETNVAIEFDDAGYVEALDLPETIKYEGIEYKVTEIGDYAFYNCRGLTSMTIPEGVTRIGNLAFVDCHFLASVTIPNSVTTIGTAFLNCSALRYVRSEINKPFAIDAAAFRILSPDVALSVPIGCKSLYETTDGWKNAFSQIVEAGEEFVVNGIASVPVWFTITSKNTVKVGRKVERKEGTALDGSGAEVIDLPETIAHGGVVYRVTEIGAFSFYNCSSLTSVTIPNSVTTIGDMAFVECRGLTSVIIPNGVTSIGHTAFYRCGLTSVTIPNSVTTIRDWAFYDCKGLTSVSIPDGVTTIGDYAFGGCESLTSVTIPSGITSIGNYTFFACENLTSVSIPNHVTTIGYDAFRGCSSLTSLTIPHGVTSIGTKAFSGCTGLKDVYSEIETPFAIDASVFENLSSDVVLHVPSGSKSLYEAADGWKGTFSQIVEEKEYEPVEFQLSVSNVPVWFTVTGKNTVKVGRLNGSSTTPAIDASTAGVIDLPATVVHDGKTYQVTEIGSYAFYNCRSLTTVTIPNSITSIGSYAFYYCYGLTSVTIPDGVTSISACVFYGCSSLTSVTIPDGVTSIGNNAFRYCSKLISVTIPSSVTSIGNNAFQYCRNLQNVRSEIKSPFAIDATVFSNINSDAVLFVPIGSKSNYVATDGWKNAFSLIVEGEAASAEFQSTVSDVPVWFTITGEGTVKVGRLLGNNTNIAIDASTAGAIDLPATVVHDGKTYQITEIGSYAFYNCRNLTSVTVPNGVTSIANYAFYYCSSLTSMVIPNGVTALGNACFYGLTITSLILPSTLESIEGLAIGFNRNLTELVIPASVTSIASTALSGCNNLSSLSVAAGNKTYDSRDGICAVIETATNKLIIGTNKLTTIPSSVTAIGDYAFRSTSGLNLTIPKSVTNIGNYAFSYCSNSVICVPQSVTTIGNYAFGYCSNSVITVLRDEPLDISEDVFQDCGTRNVTLRVPAGSKDKYKSATGWSVLGDNILEGNEGAEFTATVSGVKMTFTVTGESTAKVGFLNGGFDKQAVSRDEASGKDIVIPEQVTYNGHTYTVTEIGDYSFRNVQIKSLTLPSTLNTIGTWAIVDNSNITELVIPVSVTSIAPQAIIDCVNAKLRVDEDNKNYDSRDGVNAIVETNTNKIIVGTRNVTTIPSTITAIGEYAFSYSSGLNLTIPEAVKTIGDNAFYRCSNSVITAPWAKPLDISENVFYDCGTRNVTLRVPAGTKETYKSATGWSVLGDNILEGNEGAEFTAIVSGVKMKFTITSSNTVKVGSFLGTWDDRAVNRDDIKGKSIVIPKTVSYLGNDYTVTAIGTSSFNNCSDFSLTLPSTVTSIGDNAFFWCRNVVLTVPFGSPLAVSENVFGGASQNNFKLRVPAGKKTAYKETTGWSAFGDNILEGDEGTEFQANVGNLSMWFTVTGENTVKVGRLNGSNTNIAIDASTAGAIDLPKTVVYDGKTYQITEIGSYAFYYCSGLTSITIPEGVKTLGNSCFYGLTITSLTLPSTLESIGGLAIGYNRNLTELVIPASVTSMASTALSQCNSLSSLSVAEGNKIYDSRGGICAVIETATNKLFIGTNKVTTIPSSVTAIGDYAFRATSGLNLTIPETVTAIGERAFLLSSNCNITIPKSVTSIGIYAFDRCSNSVITVLRDEPLDISEDVFRDCGTRNVTLRVPAGSKDKYKSATGWSAFGDNILEGDEGTEFQANVGNLNMWFTVTGENTVKVGRLNGNWENVAINASTAGAVDLPETVVHNGTTYQITEIGSYAFYNCNKLTSVTMPNGVTSIGDFAFYYCYGLTSVTMSNSISSIGSYAFYNCNGITSLAIPNSVTSIGENAFNNCRRLATFTIPDGVTSIKDGAFYCTNLTSVTIPIGVTSIGEYAFAYSSNLVSVTIPSSVTSIGNNAFEYCSNLQNVRSEVENPFAIDATVFSNINSDAVLFVPVGSKSNYVATDGWKNAFSLIVEGDAKSAEFQSEVSNVPVWFTITGENTVKVGRLFGSEENLAIDVSTTGAIDLPETVVHDGKTYQITEIGSYAFYNCSRLTSITIPDGLRAIGNYSLYRVNVASLTLPSTLESIGDWAIVENRSLTELVIPASVNYIGRGAINSCYNLSSLSVANGNKTYDSRGGICAVIETATNKLVIGTNKMTTIPSSVTAISDYAFSHSSDLNLTIPESVTTISHGAFMSCKNSVITIPQSVTNIANYAFSYCSNSVIAVLGIDPLNIPEYVFWDSGTRNVSLRVPVGSKEKYKGATGWSVLGDNIFEGEEGTEFVATVSGLEMAFSVIGANTAKVGFLATQGQAVNREAASGKDIVIPSEITDPATNKTYTVKALGYECFRYMQAMSLTLPSTLESIDGYAFADCDGLTLTIPENVTFIGEYAFAWSKNSVITVQSADPLEIGKTVFWSTGNNNVTLRVPVGSKEKYESATGWNAVSEIVEIKEIESNDVTYEVKEDNTVEVKTAEVNATTGSVSIAQKVVVNEVAVTVTAIAPKAFQNVEAVKSVTIPATVESIGDLAFAGCKNLKEVLCLNPDPVNLSVAAARGLLKDGESGGTVSQFDGVDLKGCTLYVLNGSEEKYKDAAGWNSFGTIKPFAGMGDVNTDKSIDVSDVVGEVNQILGKASDGFLYGAGDMNADNSIDVSDVVSIVNVILGKTAGARSMERLSAVAETTASDHLSLMAGNEGGLSLVLDNTADYIAAQFDVRLSEGQTLEKVVKGQRARGHQLATAKMSDGVYRVLIYTIGDRTFSGQSGEVVSLGVAGQGDVTVENITFITAGENRKKFDDLSNQLTGIDAVLNDNGEMINDKTVWHDLQGRKLEAAPTTKGVYLKNGKKVVVK